MQVPLMYDASSEAKKQYMFAMSSGVPSLFSGVFDFIMSIIFSGIAATISVAINQGATAFTNMPFFPNSRAQVLVMPITPALVAT